MHVLHFQNMHILEIPSTVFRRTYALSFGFKMKNRTKKFSWVKTKNNSNFALKHAERSDHSFSVYLMNHLFQTSALFIT